MPLPVEDAAALRTHLVGARLAGDVRTSPSATSDNCRRLVAGDVDCTFGLSDWRDATVEEALDAVAALCGLEVG